MAIVVIAVDSQFLAKSSNGESTGGRSVHYSACEGVGLSPQLLLLVVDRLAYGGGRRRFDGRRCVRIPRPARLFDPSCGGIRHSRIVLPGNGRDRCQGPVPPSVHLAVPAVIEQRPRRI